MKLLILFLTAGFVNCSAHKQPTVDTTDASVEVDNSFCDIDWRTPLVYTDLDRPDHPPQTFTFNEYVAACDIKTEGTHRQCKDNVLYLACEEHSERWEALPTNDGYLVTVTLYDGPTGMDPDVVHLHITEKK